MVLSKPQVLEVDPTWNIHICTILARSTKLCIYTCTCRFLGYMYVIVRDEKA